MWLSRSNVTMEMKEDLQTENDQRLVFAWAVAQSVTLIHEDR